MPIYVGGDGNDTLPATGGGDASDDNIRGLDGFDTLYGGAGNDVLDGGNDADVIYGGSGDDLIYGGLGNDAIFAGTGADTIYGDGGQDQHYNLSNGNDTIYISDSAVVLIDAGSNDLDVLGMDFRGNSVGVYASMEQFKAVDPASGILHANDGTMTRNVIGMDRIQFFFGSAFDDYFNVFEYQFGLTYFNDGSNGLPEQAGTAIDGGGGNDQLSGGRGNDVMNGGTGDDQVNGGWGNDRVDGASGDDTITGDNGEDTLFGAGGDDNIQGGSHNDLIEGGADNDLLYGAGENDILRGGAGNDTLDGGADVDRMDGGADNDTYYVDNTGDRVNENLNEGIDQVLASISFELGANFEILVLTGSDNTSGAGNFLANVLVGNAGNNWLADQAGNDVLDGGLGADRMDGGANDDTYYVDNIGDRVNELAILGTDRVFSSITYQLSANVENLTLTGTANLSGAGNAMANLVTGNAGNNWLVGLAGNDVLDGALGGDRMEGGADNDTYYVDSTGDRVNENLNAGTDQVFASITFELGANVENLTLTGNGNTSGAGNALANVLTGNAGNNWLAGLAGNDTIDGGLGGDRMEGGIGDDTYHVDNTGDRVTEKLDEGVDQVISSITFELGANVENLTLTGSGNTSGAGNVLANVLTGNAGNNWLVGLAGNDMLDGGLGGDKMDGGTGDDTYVVDNTSDRANEKAGEGIDLVQASISFELGANVENLTLTGSGNTAGGGNALANVLTGNSGENWLVGLAGNDVLDGGLGADRLDGGADQDVFAFTTALGSGNVDRINGFVAADDTIQLENAVFTGLAAGALPAGAFNTGAEATQADDRIIYNSNTGALLFDVDGLGGAAAVHFATLSAGLSLTSADFIVI